MKLTIKDQSKYQNHNFQIKEKKNLWIEKLVKDDKKDNNGNTKKKKNWLRRSSNLA